MARSTWSFAGIYTTKMCDADAANDDTDEGVSSAGTDCGNVEDSDASAGSVSNGCLNETAEVASADGSAGTVNSNDSLGETGEGDSDAEMDYE